MLSEDQESCTSPNSQDFGQATSTAISPRPPSITAGDIAPGQFAINMLLDEVLLDIFACYVEESQMRDAWRTLASVCRRWRSIALGSPRRLNLRIFCSARIPVRKNLDFWPAFPIVLTVDYYRDLGEDNILATLEHHDRVSQIAIWNISRSLWEKVLPLMQKPFPILTDLNLRYTPWGWDGRRRPMVSSVIPVIPDSFLGGSAPRLRKLHLEYIPFPGFRKLLLSTTGLVHLHLELYEKPDSGYISADSIATCLSTLTRLESLSLRFEPPRRRPEWERRRTSSSTRALLASLTNFTFKGVGEYLEDIVDRIDAPLLDTLTIRFFHQPIFDTPRLAQFINRVPRLNTFNEARMSLSRGHASVKVLSLSKTITNASLLLENWHILGPPAFHLSPLVQLCTSSFLPALITMVEGLVIFGCPFPGLPWKNDTDLRLWQELLQPFTAVKDLYLSPEIVPYIAVILQELVGESVLELFPVLQNIFLEELQPFGPAPEGIEQFVAARQLANHPISVSRWETKVLGD
jgi:hypothetical protein